MIKMQIIMDDSKIVAESLYDLQEIHDEINNVVVKDEGFTKGDDGFYFWHGENGVSKAAGVLYLLGDSDWFTDNVKVWMYYRDNPLGKPGDYFVEDWREMTNFRLQKSG
jgi:hypothetical protein